MVETGNNLLTIKRTETNDMENEIEDGIKSENSKSWTVRKIDKKTIEKTRIAASKSGMKIGAWVDLQLSEAAERSLTKHPKNSLAGDISNLATEVYEKRSALSEDWVSKIESDIAQLIKGQHNIFLALQAIQSSGSN